MKNIVCFMAVIAVLAACTNSPKQAESTQSAVQTDMIIKKLPDYKNADFYTAEGKFNEEKAKDVVIALMEYYDYPVTPNTRESIWISDYGTGRFAELGLACIGYSNELDDGYMLQDLFLLPNQMLPEHWHVKIDKYPAKLEGWLVRNGKSYIVGVGEDNLASFPEIKIPDCHENGTATVRNVIPTGVGEFVKLKEVLTHHWQYAGKEGAIITEVANGHVNQAVRHLDKKINNHFLGI